MTSTTNSRYSGVLSANSPVKYLNMLDQQSQPFLAPGTGFVEDSFSTDIVGRMVSR